MKEGRKERRQAGRKEGRKEVLYTSENRYWYCMLYRYHPFASNGTAPFLLLLFCVSFLRLQHEHTSKTTKPIKNDCVFTYTGYDICRSLFF